MRMNNIPTKDVPIFSPKIIIKEEKIKPKNEKPITISNSPELDESSTISEIDHDFLTKRDKDVVENKFKPPERRLPRHNYPIREVRHAMNVPTRGYPDNYQNVGMLVRKNDEKILKLFGRQRFPGSNQWEYYVLENETSDSSTKIPLKIPGNKEILNNEVIAVPWLDQSKGKFDVKIFDYDVPRYNPYVF